MALLLTLVALLFPSPAGRLPLQTTRSVMHLTPSGTRRLNEQTCEVDAPSAYVEDALKTWCGDDRVAKVSLRTDTRNYIGQVQLSGTGTAEWIKKTDASMTRIRTIVDGIAEVFRMNVAITLKTAEGATLAFCARDLIASAATCAAR